MEEKGKKKKKWGQKSIVLSAGLFLPKIPKPHANIAFGIFIFFERVAKTVFGFFFFFPPLLFKTFRLLSRGLSLKLTQRAMNGGGQQQNGGGGGGGGGGGRGRRRGRGGKGKGRGGGDNNNNGNNNNGNNNGGYNANNANMNGMNGNGYNPNGQFADQSGQFAAAAPFGGAGGAGAGFGAFGGAGNQGFAGFAPFNGAQAGGYAGGNNGNNGNMNNNPGGAFPPAGGYGGQPAHQQHQQLLQPMHAPMQAGFNNNQQAMNTNNNNNGNNNGNGAPAPKFGHAPGVAQHSDGRVSEDFLAPERFADLPLDERTKRAIREKLSDVIRNYARSSILRSFFFFFYFFYLLMMGRVGFRVDDGHTCFFCCCFLLHIYISVMEGPVCVDVAPRNKLFFFFRLFARNAASILFRFFFFLFWG
jgi:hypothetical protein